VSIKPTPHHATTSSAAATTIHSLQNPKLCHAPSLLLTGSVEETIRFEHSDDLCLDHANAVHCLGIASVTTLEAPPSEAWKSASTLNGHPGTREAVFLVSNIAHPTMENDVENKLNNHTIQDEVKDEDDDEEEEEEEVWLSSDFEIGDVLDSKEEDEGSSFSLMSWNLHAQKDIL